ncbi:hypothetical protein GCM10018783_20280 [Streptomyces griseosporeus]|nr:hypothetical protein GCM10018783_20280 [Streptomyces griseosporeus]
MLSLLTLIGAREAASISENHSNRSLAGTPASGTPRHTITSPYVSGICDGILPLTTANTEPARPTGCQGRKGETDGTITAWSAPGGQRGGCPRKWPRRCGSQT